VAGVNTATSGPSFSVNKGNVDQTVVCGCPHSGYMEHESCLTRITTLTQAQEDSLRPLREKYIITGQVYCVDSTTGCYAGVYKNV